MCGCLLLGEVRCSPQSNSDPPTTCLFLYYLKTKSGIYIFKWLEKIKRKLLHDMQKLYKIQISVSICKVELRHSHANSFTCGLRLFHSNSRIERDTCTQIWSFAATRSLELLAAVKFLWFGICSFFSLKCSSSAARSARGWAHPATVCTTVRVLGAPFLPRCHLLLGRPFRSARGA